MRYELVDAPLSQDNLKPGSAFIDYDGDLNLITEGGQVVSFEDDAAPYVYGNLDTFLEYNGIRKILPPGTQITLTV